MSTGVLVFGCKVARSADQTSCVTLPQEALKRLKLRKPYTPKPLNEPYAPNPQTP